VGFYESSVNLHHNTRRYISEDNIHSLHLQNVCYFTCLGIRFKRHSDTLNNKAIRTRILSFNWTQPRDVIGLSAFLLDITPSEDIHTQRGWVITPLVGNVVGTEEESSVHSLCEWGLGFTQTYIFGFLLFGSSGYQETKYRGHLELC